MSFPWIKPKPREPAVCSALGKILWRIFSYGSSTCCGPKFQKSSDGAECTHHNIRAAKRARSSTAPDIPRSLCHLLRDLLNAEKKPASHRSSLSLEDIILDLEKMKKDPDRYLFDRICPEKAIKDAYLFGGNQEQLFGREKEMTALNCIRKRISSHVNGQVKEGEQGDNFLLELAFLGGYPGFGKGKILSSFSDVAQSQGWICLKVKFEKGVSSLALLAKAFDHFFRQLRPGSNTDLDPIKRETLRQVCLSIFCALDTKALSQLCEFIPSLSTAFSFFGMTKHSPDRRFSGVDDYESAIQRRIYLFHVLFVGLASAGRPVLLALDDMHWCDSHLMEGLMDFACNYLDSVKENQGRQGILVSGTYRSNTEQSLFTKALKTLKDSSNIKVTLIPVCELSEADTNKMISSKLGLPPQSTEDLASVVHSKARGCPFHVVQFLKCIIANGMLTFSVKEKGWIWDNDTIEMQIILATTFSKLPRQLMQTVKIMSCIGFQVEEVTFDALNSGNKLLSFNIHEQLKAAVEEGILEKAGPVYQVSTSLTMFAARVSS